MPALRDDALNASQSGRDKIVHGIHIYGEARLSLNSKAGFTLVQELVGLGAGRLYSRTARAVKYPILDEASINEAPHFSAERVHFPYKIAFRKTAYGRVTRERADTIRVLGNE
jgi:hypothetical protein